MKRLAWWAIGVGLGFSVAHLYVQNASWRGGRDFWWHLQRLTSIGSDVFTGGVILLAATVIAEALTKAAATRPTP